MSICCDIVMVLHINPFRVAIYYIVSHSKIVAIRPFEVWEGSTTTPPKLRQAIKRAFLSLRNGEVQCY